MISDNWRSSARSGLEVSSRRRTSSDSGLLSKHLLRIPSPVGPQWPGCYKRSRKKTTRSFLMQVCATTSVLTSCREKEQSGLQWMAGHSGTVHVNPAGDFCLNGGLSKEVFEPKVKVCFMRNIFVLAKVAVKLLVLM